MGRVTFQKSLQKYRTWLEPSKESIYHAKCIACDASLDISNGISNLQNHEKTKKHKDSLNLMSGQSFFAASAGKLVLIASNKPKTLSTEDQVLKAEIIRCIDIVDSNQSFSSSENDNDKYTKMFPDSDIAKSYKQKRNKVKYMIQFGIAPVLRKETMEDLTGHPYTFKFDESTTSQIKKQYDAYASYFSPTLKQVQTVYLYTLFVGQCTAEDLVGHYKEMCSTIDLDTDYCLSLGMDGPNVNKCFQNLLKTELKENGKKLLDVGTCPLHTASNAFLEGLKSLIDEVDLNKLAVDLHGFFKYSAKRVQEFLKVQEETENLTRMMSCHVVTRWISIQNVLIKLLDQYQNLKAYFLQTLPSEKGFNYKNGVGNSDHYKSIKKVLTNKKLQAIMAAVAYIAQDFKAFVVPLQADKPMIQVLYFKFRRLLQDLLPKFLNDDVYMSKGKLVSMRKITQINLSSSKNLKTHCDVGTRATAEFKKLDALEQKQVYDLMSKFLIAVTSYLISNLPLHNKVTKQARYLKPSMHLDDSVSESLCSLLENVWKALGQAVVAKVFCVAETKTLFDMKDILKKEIIEYQLDAIPKPEKPVEEMMSHRRSHQSYWREAYGLVGLHYYDKRDYSASEMDYDLYWLKIKDLTDEEGRLKYLHLATLALVVLCLPHGNAEPERGFSVSKHLLERHGPSVEEKTIIAIRTDKDHLIRCGGQSKIKISQKMLESCRNAHSKYKQYKENKEKEEALQKAEAQNKREFEERQRSITEIEKDLESAKLRLSSAEKLPDEGNALLKACKKKMYLPTFHQGQQKVDLGLGNKRKIEEEIQELEKRKVMILDELDE